MAALCFDWTMTKVSLNEIVCYCDDLLRTAEVQDYEGAANGLQVENRGRVTRIAAAVDASLATVQLAVEAKADLFILVRISTCTLACLTFARRPNFSRQD